MSSGEQLTLVDSVSDLRREGLVWTPDNPADGPSKPNPYRPVVRRYFEDPSTLPYKVPTRGAEEIARAKHRTWYWLENSFERFVCPDCERSLDDVSLVDVHHKDENVRNGLPENLVALCRRCHVWRHKSGSTVSGLDLDEWKSGFLNHAEEA